MKLLVTNDDGINSVGLLEMTKLLKEAGHEIMVVAPSKEMSATSQKLTLREGLKITKITPIIKDVATYTVDGTPADCVKVAIHLLGYMPDALFSGVNNGYNIGSDILYSGTIAAAFEANLYGIKALSFSCEKDNLEGLKYFTSIVNYLFDTKIFQNAQILNINIPKNPSTLTITHQGVFPFDVEYEQKEDGLYYIKASPLGFKVYNSPTSDVVAIKNNQISVTPLTTNRTDLEIFEKYK